MRATRHAAAVGVFFLIFGGCAHQRATNAEDVALVDAGREGVARKLEKLERRGPKSFDAPNRATEFFYEQRVEPGQTELPVDRLRLALEDARQREAARSGAVGGISSWQSVGPGNVGGRTRAIVIDPTDTNVMYAGGVAGGVWTSTDAGQSWTPTDDFMQNLAVTSIVLDPDDPSVIYAGTGEGVWANSVFVRGLGVFKSTDAGQTWSQLGATNNPNFHYVNRLVASPSTPGRLYAGTRTGVWRSDDAGATWGVVLRNPNYVAGPQPSTNGCFAGCMDLVARSDRDPDVLFAMFGNGSADGLFRSDDGGDSWVPYTVPAQQGRMSMAIHRDDNDIMYLLMADNGSGGPFGSVVNVYRSDDGGGTWSAQVDLGSQFGPLLLANTILGTGCVTTSQVYHQGWYDNAIAVDPADPDIVWVGGVDILRSDDAGVTWGLAAHWIYYTLPNPPPEYMHPDHHTIVFHPGYDGAANQSMFVGNDGGVWRTDNARAPTTQDDCPIQPPLVRPQVAWESLNNGYGVTQFYHGDVARGADRFIGGCQDNGTNIVHSRDTPDDWAIAFGGDGGYCAIDPTDDDTIYLEYHVFPSIHKSTDGGETFVEAVAGITDTDGVFITPVAMDQANPGTLWTGGRRPWRTTDGASSWHAAGADFPSAALISAIAVAPSDPGVVYMGFTNGYVANSYDADTPSPTWTVRGAGLRLGSWVSSVAVDPRNPLVAYATYSSYGGQHVFRTTDGGQSWSSIDGIATDAVPDIPVHWVEARPCDPRVLYAGTELGVFVSDDWGSSWQPVNTGLAHTVVESLDFKDTDTLTAFSHGRGVFIADLAPCDPCAAGDFALPYGQLDFIDVIVFLDRFAAESPAADLAPPLGALDFSDVLAFLAPFGAGCP